MDESPLAARVRLRTGEADPEAVVDATLPSVDADCHRTRTRALWTLVEAVGECPARTADVADAFVASLTPGQRIPDAQLRALGALAGVNARALTPVVEALAPAGTEEWAYDGSAPLAHAVIGDIVVHAPGVAKPAVDSLVGAIADSVETPNRETAWALVRIADTEPSTVRPVIAGHLWSLDSENPTVVEDALDSLGIVFGLCPDRLVELDRVADCLSHPIPDVRRAAVRALERTAFGLSASDDDRLGPRDVTRLQPYVDRIAAAASDADSDVRLEALRTLRLTAADRPGWVAQYESVVLARCADTEWVTQTAAVETVEALVSAGVVDLPTMRRRVVPLFESDDDTVQQAALECALTALSERSRDDRETARLLFGDIVWLACRSDLAVGPFDSNSHFRTLLDHGHHLHDLWSVDRALTLARNLSTAESEDARVTGACLLAVIGTDGPHRRWDAIGSLQAMLGDDSEHVRTEVVAICAEVVEAEPGVAQSLGNAVATTVAYDEELLHDATDAVERIGACDHEVAVRLADLYDAIARNDVDPSLEDDGTDDDDDDADDSGLALEGDLFGTRDPPTEILGTLAEVSPDPLTAAVPLFCERLAAMEVHDTVAPKGLAYVAADSHTLADSVCTLLQDSLDRWDPPPTAVAWISTALLLADPGETAAETARDTLHSLVEAGEADLHEPLLLLAEAKPETLAALVGALAPVRPPGITDAEPKRELAAHIETTPRLTLVQQPPDTPFGRVHSLADADAPAPSHRSMLQLPGMDRHSGFAGDGGTRDGPLEAPLLRTGSSVQRIDRERLAEKHPSPSVRDAATALVSGRGVPAGESPQCFETPPTEATRGTVDELTSYLATTDPDTLGTVCTRLVALADARDDLRESILLHCLVAAARLPPEILDDHLFDALTGLARSDGLCRPDESVDSPGDITVIFTGAESARVREVAALFPAFVSADATDDEALDALEATLSDGSPTVRERAARSIRSLVRSHPRLASRFTPSLLDALESPRYVTSTVLNVLGECLAVRPTVPESAVRQIETRLKSRSRGVRRAAGEALATLGTGHPDALTPVAQTLVGRLHEDEAERGAYTRALAAVPSHAIDAHERLAAGVVPVLLDSDGPEAAHAAGTILEGLADTHPDVVSRAVEATLLEFEDSFDGDDGPLDPHWYDDLGEASRYWLLTVLTTLSKADRSVGEAGRLFEHLVEDCRQTFLDPTLDEMGSPRRDWELTEDALVRTIFGHAAQVGDAETVERILETTPNPALPTPVIGEYLATFLVQTDGEDREGIELAALSEATRRATLRSLLDRSAEDASETAFEAVRALAPTVTERDSHRDVVAIARDALAHSAVETRYDGVQLLAELGQTDVVSADEAICHLLSSLADHQWVQEELADSIIDLGPHATLSWDTICRMAVSRLRDEGSSPALQRGCLLVVTAVATRQHGVAADGVGAVVDCLGAPSEQIQSLAGDCLETLTREVPAAVRHHRDRLSEYADTGSETASYSATRCLSILSAD